MFPQVDYGMSVSLWGTQTFPQRETKLHSKRSWENLRTHVALGYGQVRIAFSQDYSYSMVTCRLEEND